MVPGGDGTLRAGFADVPPGGYEVIIGRLHPSGRLESAITGTTLVIDPSVLNEATAVDWRD